MGVPEAIAAVFPGTVVQTCPRQGRSDRWRSQGSIHLVRRSLDFISWKDGKAVVLGLRAICRAQEAETGLAALEAFEAGPGGARKHPAVAPARRRNRDRVVPFLASPEALRRIVHTTDAIAALNSKLRCAIRARGPFPSDEAATKPLYLVLNRAAADRTRPPREGIEARAQFAITLGKPFRIS